MVTDKKKVKPLTKKSMKAEVKVIEPAIHQRIQTAEGWKRSLLKRKQEGKVRLRK